MQCHYGKTAIQLELVGKKKEAKLARSKCISFVMGIPEAKNDVHTSKGIQARQ